jgi:pSer/pThr/pTyr-binding forkhead associated (FHA) protein
MSSSPDPFFHACSGIEPIRVEVRRSSGAASEKEFAKPFIIVGRDSRSDLPLVNPEVASRSLYFQLIGGRVFAVRLADTPVKMADGRSWEAGWVQPTDEFLVGWVKLRVLNPDQRTASTPPVADDPLAPRHEGPHEFSFEPLSGRSNPPRRFSHRQDLLLIGREAPCRFLVHHPDVSRRHAAVVNTPSGPWVVDLLSRTGTTVNGGRVQATPLCNGDQVVFGSVGVKVLVEKRDPPRPLAIPGAGPTGEPVFDQIAQFQQQTFDQFRELLGAMLQMVGGVLNDHRRFLREELERLERIATASQSGASQPSLPQSPPQPALSGPEPTNGSSSLPVDRAQLQTWVSQQLDAMNRQRSTEWAEIVEKLKHTAPGG